MLRKGNRLWALLLSAALLVTQLPAVALAADDTPEAAAPTPNTVSLDGLTIAGGAAKQETDKQFKLTENNGSYTISGAWTGSLDNVDDMHQKAVITVPNGVTASVTLSNVSIDVSRTDYACAFAVEAGGTANITLSGTNALTSGAFRAGLEAPENAKAAIDGSGSLTATGGNSGAGIGGGPSGGGGTIEISGGTVTAKGGNSHYGDGAGIGGGSGSGSGSGGTVEISGKNTTVTATGGGSGFDVGAGAGGSSGSLSVTDGATLEMKNTGTDVTDPVYKSCTIIDKNGNAVSYDANGNPNAPNVPTAQYDSRDVEVINRIIDNSNLGWTKNDPASWPTAPSSGHYLVWDGSTPRRITNLFISNIGLSGTLDVTGLTCLEYLHCYNNSLMGTLNVSGLTNLQFLSCFGNSLTGLDMTGLTSLQNLLCNDNSLTELNVTGLTSLNTLFCYRNSLTELDVTGLNNLEGLNCSDNPFRSLKLPGGEALTVNIDPAGGGTVMFSHDRTQNLMEDKSVALTAAAETGYAFTGWTGDASGGGNPYPFTLDSDKSITANFRSLDGGGSSSSSGESDSSEPEPQSSYTAAGDNLSRSISRSDLKRLADSGKRLTLRCDKISMTFDPAALNAILAAVPRSGRITFAAAPADLSPFPDAAERIGDHPVYDFTIRCKDSKGNLVTVPVNFPAGSAAITLSYTPAPTEVTESLFLVYVDGEGAVTWLDESSYDNGEMLAEVPHFSTYGVAYKAPAPVLTDVSGHWAKQDIEFVAARGLLSGTGDNRFSPDGTMTRGMFVTALGRLAGVNPDSRQTNSFADVKADAYYAAYVEWAAQENIVKGTGDKRFSPDDPVTREQMAVMMTNYARQMGDSMPTPLAAAIFADNDEISAWAAREVAAMQRAGIVKGKDGNRFDPQGNATRAEVSAVLRRFVEIVIDPAGTKIDGNESGPDGARKEEA